MPSGTPRTTTATARRKGRHCMEYGNGKEDHGYVKLQVPAGRPILRSDRSRARSARLEHHGICKAFNAGRRRWKRDADPGCDHSLPGRSFTFEMKLPPVSYFLKKASVSSLVEDRGRGLRARSRKRRFKRLPRKKMPDLIVPR